MKSIAILALLSLASAEDVKKNSVEADIKAFVEEEDAKPMNFDQKEVENLGQKMEDGAEDMLLYYNSYYKSTYDSTFGRYYNPSSYTYTYYKPTYTYSYTYYTYTYKPTHTYTYTYTYKPTYTYTYGYRLEGEQMPEAVSLAKTDAKEDLFAVPEGVEEVMIANPEQLDEKEFADGATDAAIYYNSYYRSSYNYTFRRYYNFKYGASYYTLAKEEAPNQILAKTDAAQDLDAKMTEGAQDALIYYNSYYRSSYNYTFRRYYNFKYGASYYSLAKEEAPQTNLAEEMTEGATNAYVYYNSYTRSSYDYTFKRYYNFKYNYYTYTYKLDDTASATELIESPNMEGGMSTMTMALLSMSILGSAAFFSTKCKKNKDIYTPLNTPVSVEFVQAP